MVCSPVWEQGSVDNSTHWHNCASEDAVAEMVQQRTHEHTKQDCKDSWHDQEWFMWMC